jgi:hypothetical protein
MRRIFTCGLYGCTIFFHDIFPYYPIKKQFSEKKKLNIKYVLIASKTLFLTVLIIRRNDKDMIKMNNGFHLKYALFLPNFIET